MVKLKSQDELIQVTFYTKTILFQPKSQPHNTSIIWVGPTSLDFDFYEPISFLKLKYLRKTINALEPIRALGQFQVRMLP